MQKIKISIIIPIYNVRDYLSQCIDSLITTLPERCEVILVNDGSTDDSLEVCEVFQKAHPEIICILNKENGGLSDARNAGTAIALGEYIYYLDSDDWITSDAIQELYDFAIKNNCDVVQGGFYYAFEKHLLYDNRWIGDTETPFVLEHDEAMHQLVLGHYIKNFAWGKLYRADIVKKHPFPKGKYFEDSYWQHLIISEVSRYGVIPKPLYYYRQRSNGISGCFSKRNLDMLKGYKERINFIRLYYPQYLTELKHKYKRLCISFNESAIATGNEEVIKVYYDYLKKEGIAYNRLAYKIHAFIFRVWTHFFAKQLKRIER